MSNADRIKAQQIPEPGYARFLFADVRMSPVWLIIRLYLGYEWLVAGLDKLGDPVWTGPNAGTALSGFAQGALSKTGGEHPDVTGWYAAFLENVVLPNATVFSYLVTWGEILVGVALIVGLFTGIAAFFGAFMNANYLLAGTVSSNPVLLMLAVFVILAWRVAGYVGLDYFALPLLGVPGRPGRLFRGKW